MTVEMPSLELLTDMDKQLLRKSWAIVNKDTEAIATDIFQMIFEQAPDAKLMFNFMLKDYKDDVKKSREFTFHALRFIQIIESTVEHLDNPDALNPLFMNLGRLHAKHEEQLGFSSHYWSVFKECVLHHFRRAMKSDRKNGKSRPTMNEQEIDSVIILWREVLRFIIDHMKVGLEANGRIRKANRDLRNEEHERNGSAPENQSIQHNITQVTHALRKTDLSLIVPDYFMQRRKSNSSKSSGSEDNSAV